MTVGAFDGAADGHFRRGSWLAIFVGFGLLMVVALCAVAVAISEDQTSHASRLSRDVRDAQSALFSVVQDAEIGERGYLLTGDERYLKPFESAKARLPGIKAKLQAAVEGDATQRRRLDEIRALTDKKLAEVDQSIQFRRAGNADAASAIVKSGPERILMEQLRSDNTAFDRAESRVADKRRQGLTVQRQALIWIMIGALVVAVGLAAFVGLEVRRYAVALAAQNAALRREAAERERAEAQLRQSQKMEAVGQLTGGIAHDFNNMLAIVIGNLDIMLRRLSGADERVRTLAEHALTGANKAANLTRRLLAFSRLQPLDPHPTDVNRCVGDMSEILRRTLGERISIETVQGGGLWRALIDGPQLESAILNLAVNARDAMAPGGRLTIETANASIDPGYAEDHGIEAGQYVLVAVTDTGQGMTAEVLEKAFDPFFTTKGVGEGTGLGLSQVHGFIRQSRGHVKIYTELGVGTSIKLYLPRDRSDGPAAETAAPARGSSDNSNYTVLIVEDDDEVRRFAGDAARELGFNVVEADRASAALDLLSKDPQISLLLTDVVMPGVTGRQLADMALERRPGLPIVYMTGYTRNAIVHNGALDPGTRLLTKPFTLEDLDRELNAALSAAHG